MKRLLVILLLATPAAASGPKFVGNDIDRNIYQEILNLYQDIRNPVIANGSASTFTATNFKASSIAYNLSGLVPSTGTVTSTDNILQAFGKLSNARVVQVVIGSATAQDTTTSASFVNTSLAITITPTLSTNKILVAAYGLLIEEASNVARAVIVRNTTDLAGPNSNSTFCFALFTGTGVLEVPCAMAWIDYPNTTSATTYRVQFKSDGTHNADWGNTDVTSTIIAMEIGQ